MMRSALAAGLLTVAVLWCPSLASDGEFPSDESIQRRSGFLVTADFIHRNGQFRERATGELIDFVLAPYAPIMYRGAEADLRDVRLETAFEFLFTDQVRNGRRVLAAMTAQNTVHDQAATDEQLAGHAAFVKHRGLAGWVDRTEGNRLTITLFSGAPERFQRDWMGEFKPAADLNVVVANDELRTWNPGVDREKATLAEIQVTPARGYGDSGVRLVVTVPNMLEGFRRGRVVRVFGPGWPLKDQFYGESLMGYGYTRLQDKEIIELTPKEYPDQFPFRTDYGNEHLPWYEVRSDSSAPPYSEHLVFGQLVQVDAENRTGRFLVDRSGEAVDFALDVPRRAVRYLNADAELGDLPLGARYRFHMYQDEQGAFVSASLVSDEFSHLAQNTVSYRIESLELASDAREGGKLFVARQIPDVKNYNGDMERTPDLGRTVLLVNADTRVHKGADLVSLADLAVGDALLVNVTAELPGNPSRCTDVWVGAEAQKVATDGQQKKFDAAKPVVKSKTAKK